MFKCLNVKMKERGISLYISMAIMTILLAIVLGVSTILLGQVRMFREMGDSVIAFYAADTGIEQELREKNYLIRSGAYSNCLDLNGGGCALAGAGDCLIDGVIDPGDACYKVDYTVSPSNVKSIGVFKKTQRAVEVTF